MNTNDVSGPPSPYRIPTGLAAATAVGLASALLGDGVWNVVSWVCLSLPFVVLLARVRRGRARNASSMTSEVRG